MWGLVGACLATLALSLLAVESEPSGATGSVGPNILLIITDDQAPGTVVSGGAGDGELHGMPNTIREFADRGRRFTRAFVTTPLCCPSRSSIYSGLYAHNHGVMVNHGELLDADRTWQRYLDDAGYLTGIAGKYLNGVSPEEAPYFDFARSWGLHAPDDAELAAASADEFLAGAESDDPRPWALVLAPHSPHAPYPPGNPLRADVPPYRPSGAYEEADLSDKHPSVKEAATSYRRRDGARAWGHQMTELQAVDDMVGEVFARLRQLDEGENTLAFLISDNGYELGDHRLLSKAWPYDQAVRVPLYAVWPGHIPPGTTSDSIVANIDIAPTIYDATGIDPGYEPDGRTLLRPSERREILLELPEGWRRHVPPWSAIWRPKRYYVQWEDGFVEDYDLRADPDETEASNAPDPKQTALLERLSTCAGEECP